MKIEKEDNNLARFLIADNKQKTRNNFPGDVKCVHRAPTLKLQRKRKPGEVLVNRIL
jgi:hypothetical protein